MHTLRTAQRRALQQLFSSRPHGFRQLYKSTQPTFRTRSSPRASQSVHSRAFSSILRSSIRPFARTTRRFQSTTSTSQPTESLSLSQRLKKLSREYGWSAVGIYLALSALDFPFCFLAVRTLGTDRIGQWEHAVVSTVKEWVIWPLSGTPVHDDVEKAVDEGERVVLKAPLEEVRKAQGQSPPDALHRKEAGNVRILEEEETYVVADHGYKQAEEANRSNASLWTQLALAYAIHKSFIFLRVPLTAAVTPKVVKTLRGWGWNIGKMPKRSAKKVSAGGAGKGEAGTGSGTGVNTRGSGVKPDN